MVLKPPYWLLHLYVSNFSMILKSRLLLFNGILPGVFIKKLTIITTPPLHRIHNVFIIGVENHQF